MKRTASPRSSIDNPYSSALATGDHNTPDASAHEKEKGFLHLLKNHTLDDIVRLMADDPLSRCQHMEKFLLDGTPPNGLWLKNTMAEWLLGHREPQVLLALLDHGPLSVHLISEQNARTLRDAVETRRPISGLEIQVSSVEHNVFAPQVVALLIEALRISNGLDTWRISGRDYRKHGLSPLLDALGCIKNLTYATAYSELGPDDVMAIAELATKNKEIKVLDLGFRVPKLLQDAYPAPEPMNSLLAELKTQNGLSRLCLAGVPRECQKLLGEFIGESHALRHLDISLYGSDATEPLIAGLQQNTTLRSLVLDVDSIEDGMLPLIGLLSEKQCSPAHFVLETRTGRRDGKDSLVIGEMIGNNAVTHAFTWRFRDQKTIDFELLGAGLQRNRTLDTFILNKTGPRPGEPVGFRRWIEGDLPELAALLDKNRTLTQLDLLVLGTARQIVPAIETILERNRSYQRYACSTGFMQGAAEGFFAALNMPSELGQPTAPYLSAQKPLIEAASLALVNKTTYGWALGRRREECARAMDEALAGAEGSKADGADRMVALLKWLVATPQDFSGDALRKIASSPLIAHALVSVMENSQSEFDCLVRLLGEAAGVGLIRMLVMMEIQQRQRSATMPYA
jgi:hypothetical protein